MRQRAGPFFCRTQWNYRLEQICCDAGRKDTWNGIYGGLAAGAALGLRMGKIPVGVGAAFAMAAVSAAVDTTGGHLVGRGLVDDNATPPHAIYPYKT